MIAFIGLLVLALPALIVCVYGAVYVLAYSVATLCRAIAWWADR